MVKSVSGKRECRQLSSERQFRPFQWSLSYYSTQCRELVECIKARVRQGTVNAPLQELEFRPCLFEWLFQMRVARRSEATPTCIKTSTRLGAKWLTLDEKYGIINSSINKNLLNRGI